MQKFCTRTIELGQVGACARAVLGSEVKSALAAAIAAMDTRAPASARLGAVTGSRSTTALRGSSMRPFEHAPVQAEPTVREVNAIGVAPMRS